MFHNNNYWLHLDFLIDENEPHLESNAAQNGSLAFKNGFVYCTSPQEDNETLITCESPSSTFLAFPVWQMLLWNLFEFQGDAVKAFLCQDLPELSTELKEAEKEGRLREETNPFVRIFASHLQQSFPTGRSKALYKAYAEKIVKKYEVFKDQGSDDYVRL